MMTLGPFHERQKAGLELFITIVAGELKIRRQPMGSATWRRKALERAIESDLCYYFDPAKLARGMVRHTQTTSTTTLIRIWLLRLISRHPGLTGQESTLHFKYRKSGVRVTGRVSIDQLDPDGRYVRANRSRFLPVRPEDVTRWVFNEDANDLVIWEERLREWVRSELVPICDP